MSQVPSTPATPGVAAETEGPSASAGVREQAASAAESAKVQAGEVATATSQQVQNVAVDAKQQARRMVHQSREQLLHQADEQTTRLAAGVRDISQQLHGVVRGEPGPHGVVTDLAVEAAQVTSRLADELEQRRPEELLDEVRRFARRRPGVFLLGAMGAGLVAGRLVRAVDTSGLVDAAKSGVSDGQTSETDSPGLPQAAATSGASFPEQLTPAVRP